MLNKAKQSAKDSFLLDIVKYDIMQQRRRSGLKRVNCRRMMKDDVKRDPEKSRKLARLAASSHPILGSQWTEFQIPSLSVAGYLMYTNAAWGSTLFRPFGHSSALLSSLPTI